MKGTISCVAYDKARAVSAEATLAAQRTGLRLRLHTRAVATQTNAPSRHAVAAAGHTLNRSVSSHSMGERIKEDVQA